MYEIVVDQFDSESFDENRAYFKFESKIKDQGYVTLTDLDFMYRPLILQGNYSRNDNFGWTKWESVECGYPLFKKSNDLWLVILPDPIDLRKKIPFGFVLSGFDAVCKPAHYTEGRKYEPRKVIADWCLNFNLGNAVKHIARAGRKGDKIEDLRKAIQYIEFEIEELEGEDQNE